MSKTKPPLHPKSQRKTKLRLKGIGRIASALGYTETHLWYCLTGRRVASEELRRGIVLYSLSETAPNKTTKPKRRL